MRFQAVKQTAREWRDASDPARLTSAFGQLRLMAPGWVASFSKQLKPIKLLAEHVFYRRRDLLESAIDDSTGAIRQLDAGVFGAACQLPVRVPATPDACGGPSAPESEARLTNIGA